MSNRYYRTRKERGLKQKMFLLRVEQFEEENEWCFIVKGTTNDYTIEIKQNNFNCTCPDFGKRGRICKHLYFIIGRIAQCDDLIITLESDIEKGTRDSIMNFEELKTLTAGLVYRLRERLNTSSKLDKHETIQSNKIQGDCSICYEELSHSEVLSCKYGIEPHCTGYFHEECISAWLQKNSSCPLCRRKWNSKYSNTHETDETYDPLDKIATVALNYKTLSNMFASNTTEATTPNIDIDINVLQPDTTIDIVPSIDVDINVLQPDTTTGYTMHNIDVLQPDTIVDIVTQY